MTKTIHTKVTDEMYYKLVSVKAKHHFDTYIQLFEYIIKQESIEQPQHPEQTKQPKPLDTPLCLCGHPGSYHTEDGCMGDGGLCECRQETF